MKKFRLLLIVCLALLLLGPVVAEAARGDREALNFGYVNVVSTAQDKVLLAKPSYIYGITLYPDPTSTGIAQVLVYDLATAATGTIGEKIVIEVVETVQYATVRYKFNIPIQVRNGAYVDVQNASVVIEYR